MRHTTSSKQMPRPAGRHIARLTLLLGLAAASSLVEAVLVQPNNYMLDDSPLTQQHDTAGSLSPFYADQTSSSEQAADKDIVSIIGDGLARLRLARMLEQQQQDEPSGQLSQEMADLIQEHQQQELAAKSEAGGEQSLSASVASMLMNAAAAANPAGPSEEPAGQNSPGQIVELETNQANQNLGSPSKADLKAAGTSQWYNPKEVIPVLKISSMATPSKYKKVYFRSEKKLVDGAFHSTSPSEEQKKPAALANVAKPLGSAVQRRSSRGSSGGAPPSVLQDGVLDFLRKFHDVYVQTRPTGASTGSSLGANLLSAASSPIAALLAPASRPNLASAISTASQMVSSATAVSQASASGGAAASQTPSSSTAGVAAAPGGQTAAASGPSKSPLSTQTYVNFWSKTFPTWVRKTLKQMRRRSLYNSSKRQQQQQQHAHGISQKAAASSVASESAGAHSQAAASS